MANRVLPFDEFEADLHGRIQPGMNSYEWVGRTNSLFANRLRQYICDWALNIPEYTYNEWIRSFRSRQHHDSFFELILHEYLLKIGLAPEMTPPGEERTPWPDFVCSNHGIKLAVEATCFGKDAAAAFTPETDSVIHELTSINCSPLVLGMNVISEPTKQPSSAKIAQQFRDQLKDLEQIGDPVGASFSINANDGHYKFEVIGKRPNNKNGPVLGAFMPESAHFQSSVPFRNAVKRKARKYPTLDCGLIVAVNNRDYMHDVEASIEVLFGSSAYHVNSGETLWRWDGLFGTPEIPEHQNVVGVLVTQRVRATNFFSIKPKFFQNPWTQYSDEILWPGLETWQLVDDSFGRVQEGKSFADLLDTQDLETLFLQS